MLLIALGVWTARMEWWLVGNSRATPVFYMCLALQAVDLAPLA